jgi:hypothetical protein
MYIAIGVAFEILTALIVKSSVLWNITLISLVNVN